MIIEIAYFYLLCAMEKYSQYIRIFPSALCRKAA